MTTKSLNAKLYPVRKRYEEFLKANCGLNPEHQVVF